MSTFSPRQGHSFRQQSVWNRLLGWRPCSLTQNGQKYCKPIPVTWLTGRFVFFITSEFATIYKFEILGPCIVHYGMPFLRELKISCIVNTKKIFLCLVMCLRKLGCSEFSSRQLINVMFQISPHIFHLYRSLPTKLAYIISSKLGVACHVTIHFLFFDILTTEVQLICLILKWNSVSKNQLALDNNDYVLKKLFKKYFHSMIL